MNFLLQNPSQSSNSSNIVNTTITDIANNKEIENLLNINKIYEGTVNSNNCQFKISFDELQKHNTNVS